MPEDKREAYEKVAQAIRSCQRCPLYRLRTNAVPGEGNLEADVMLVGEAPGRTEDEQGRPFVGAAGQLLNETLEMAGMPRPSVYITNVVKCRPPNNRTPTDEEVAACVGYLKEEIRLVRPKVIVALGNTAGSALFSLASLKWRGATAERGSRVRASIEGIEVLLLPTYHPAAALYKPDLKRALQDDLSLAARLAGKGAKGRTLLDFMGA
ncbi:MAG: uracil-DNA glycosylase family protein [Acidilobus sp.]